MQLSVRSSALKHGITVKSIEHAVTFCVLVDEEFEGSESPKVLVLGHDQAGNIIEVIGIVDKDDLFTVFHAMPARTGYINMLKRRENL
jgi:hypothetical protein